MTTSVAIGRMPGTQRPARIPEHIEMLEVEPPYATVMQNACWHLRFRLARDIAGGSMLRLQIYGGRNNPGPFGPMQTDRPGEDGFVTARVVEGRRIVVRTDFEDSGPAVKDGHQLVVGAGHPGLLSLTVPPDGLAGGVVIEVSLGDRSGGGGGISAPRVPVLNKFFVLYQPESETDRPHFWGEENQDRIVAACSMHVLGGEPHHLRVYAPSQCAPGEEVVVLARLEDRRGALSHVDAKRLRLWSGDDELSCVAESVAGSGCVRLKASLRDEGVHRLRVTEGAHSFEARANPTICRADTGGSNTYWGMIHGHTELSDGTGTIERYFEQLRDEAALDFGASGDHDHAWETSEVMWRRTGETVASFNEPGRFVAFLGYEWAKWRKNGDGDRNVYYLEDHRPLYRSDDGLCATPSELFEALCDERAIVIPHHPGHFGNWCDWKDHDPALERLVEIFQCRGSYECADGPALEKGKEPTRPEGLVSRALELGWRVGFTAGGDDHQGQAGTDFQIHSYQAGLMSVCAGERTREAIWQGLWNRRVVATTGPRILLDWRVNGQPMGSELQTASMPELGRRRRFEIEFHGTAPAARIELIRNNEVVHAVESPGLDCALRWEDETPLKDTLLPPARFCPNPFSFYYVRAVQTDGHVAWASPAWIDP